MPYIPPADRPSLRPSSYTKATTPGELNYQVSCLVGDYLLKNGLNYRHINDVIGVLECAKIEAYRRIAVPYEDDKIVDNGDVYSVALNEGTNHA